MGVDKTTFTEVTQFGQTVTDVAIGGMNTYVVSNGKLYGAGDNAFGVLPGTIDNTLFNELTTGVNEDIVSVGVAVQHGMFITESGKLYGVGTQSFGQIGNDSTTALTSFTRINAVDTNGDAVNFSKVSLCPTNTFVISSKGKLFAGGDAYFGALGNGLTVQAHNLVQVTE